MRAAAWPSGKAGVCKTLTPSSNLGAALNNKKDRLQSNRSFLMPSGIFSDLLTLSL